MELEHLGKHVHLISHMGDDSSVVDAARVSYGTGTKRLRDDKALINYLMANGHMSPFEFVEFTFHVKAPIFVARQWFRHRTGSYAEVSGRYSVLDDGTYIPLRSAIRKTTTVAEHDMRNRDGDPPELVDIIEHANTFTNATKVAIDSYNKLLEGGVVREQARIVLNMGTMTRFYFKMDLRNLFSFLKQRLDEHAQAEIRQYAERILELITPIVPHSVEAWKNFVLESVPLSSREWERLIDTFGKDAVLDALVGAEPSKSRVRWLEDRANRVGALKLIHKDKP